MLLDNIVNLINKNINEYNTKISEKYGIDIEELQSLWFEFSGSSSKKKVGKNKKEEPDSESEDTEFDPTKGFDPLQCDFHVKDATNDEDENIPTDGWDNFEELSKFNSSFNR